MILLKDSPITYSTSKIITDQLTSLPSPFVKEHQEPPHKAKSPHRRQWTAAEMTVRRIDPPLPSLNNLFTAEEKTRLNKCKGQLSRRHLNLYPPAI